MSEARRARRQAERDAKKKPRRSSVKYVREEPFVNVNGDDYAIPETKKSAAVEQATVGQLLHLNLDQWQPRQGQVLVTGELRTLNKIIDILEAEPQEQGYYRFEDADFALMKQVVNWQAPLSMIRNAPLLEDYLTAALSELSKDTIGDPKATEEFEAA